MAIICATCGGHFNSVENIKEHTKNCPSKKQNNLYDITLNEYNSTNTPKQTEKLEVIYPPPIPFPKKSKIGKPFLGASKNEELTDDKERFCGLCHNKGLIAHIVKKKKYAYIDAYWCHNCNMVLWPRNTSTN